jgi:type IV secretory pathway VirB3-like protein
MENDGALNFKFPMILLYDVMLHQKKEITLTMDHAVVMLQIQWQKTTNGHNPHWDDMSYSVRKRIGEKK